jgi:hypothetical protein
MTDDTARFDVTIDLDAIDWDALEGIENLVGHPIADEFATGKLSFRTIRAFALWKLREKSPEMTFETMPSMRSMTVNIAHLAPVTAATKRDPLALPRPRARSRS